MARKISDSLRNSIVAQESADVKIFLITLTQDGLDEPIRVCSQGTQRVEETMERVSYGVISNGITYEQAGFSIVLSEDSDGAIPTVQVSIPNASRDIITAIEKLDNKPVRVSIDMILADNPDDVVMSLVDFDMTNIKYDDDVISGTITRELLFQEPVPCHRFTPTAFPFLGW